MHDVALHFIYVLVAIFATIESKRYAIDEQCQQEYGMDLSAVLRNFRRSDDYLRILSIQAKDFHVFFTDVIFQSYDWNLEKMRLRISAEFGLNDTGTTIATTTDSDVFNSSQAAGRNRYLRSKLSRRQNAVENQKTMEKVYRVDNYPKLKSHLTVSERNRYKDVGFEFAGEVFHATLFAFGGRLNDDDGSASTRLDVEAEPTTQHVLKHVPTIYPPRKEETTTQAPLSLVGRGNTRFGLVSRFGDKFLGS